jgi:hypothetical protein
MPFPALVRSRVAAVRALAQVRGGLPFFERSRRFGAFAPY